MFGGVSRRGTSPDMLNMIQVTTQSSLSNHDRQHWLDDECQHWVNHDRQGWLLVPKKHRRISKNTSTRTESVTDITVSKRCKSTKIQVNQAIRIWKKRQTFPTHVPSRSQILRLVNDAKQPRSSMAEIPPARPHMSVSKRCESTKIQVNQAIRIWKKRRSLPYIIRVIRKQQINQWFSHTYLGKVRSVSHTYLGKVLLESGLKFC